MQAISDANVAIAQIEGRFFDPARVEKDYQEGAFAIRAAFTQRAMLLWLARELIQTGVAVPFVSSILASLGLEASIAALSGDAGGEEMR